MASSVTPANTFATQSGNVNASELDTNFSDADTALNTLLTFSNYFADTGVANAMVVNVPSPQVFTYTAGVALQVLVANANTGATTINVNAVGAKSVVSANGSALGSGQLPSGALVTLLYDGTRFQLVGVPVIFPANVGGGVLKQAALTSGTVTVQSGGSPSGGSDGDLFLIY